MERPNYVWGDKMGKRSLCALLAMGWLIFICGCQHIKEQEISTVTHASTTPVTVKTTTSTTRQSTSTRRHPSTAVQTTTKTTQSTAPTATMSHLIQNIPRICQFPEFPSGCESVASVIALQYMKEPISVTNFINNYLPMGAVYRKDGILYGPDPYEQFVGDPRSQYALGCFAPVIEKAIVRYFGDEKRVKNTTGETLDSLCEQYVSRNIPALVWVSIYMKDTGKGNVWYTENGKRFQWITNEHCMVLIGYDTNGYYFQDPYSGNQLYYDKALSARRYDTFGKQSLVILP